MASTCQRRGATCSRTPWWSTTAASRTTNCDRRCTRPRRGLVDCASAIELVRLPYPPPESFGRYRRMRALVRDLRKQQVKVRLRWVPAHGREARRPWSPPEGWTHQVARALNQKADDGATDGPEEATTVDRLVRLRHIQEAKRWEHEAVEIAIKSLTDYEEWHDREADRDWDEAQQTNAGDPEAGSRHLLADAGGAGEGGRAPGADEGSAAAPTS